MGGLGGGAGQGMHTVKTHASQKSHCHCAVFTRSLPVSEQRGLHSRFNLYRAANPSLDLCVMKPSFECSDRILTLFVPSNSERVASPGPGNIEAKGSDVGVRAGRTR